MTTKGSKLSSSHPTPMPAGKAPPSPSSALVRPKSKKTKSSSNHPRRQLKRQPNKDETVDDEIDTANAGDASATADSPGYGSAGGGVGGMGMMMPGMGMGMGGMGMGMGMYGMGMGGMGMGGMYGMGGMMGSQWLMSLNQFLFGIQSVVFSLGQAIQIVGMNAQQIQHVYGSVKGMMENALGHVQDHLGKLSDLDEVMGRRGEGARRWMLGEDGTRRRCAGAEEDENREVILTQGEIIRRRRLAAFRWTMALGVSYFICRAARRMLQALIYGGGGAREANRWGLPMQQNYHSAGRSLNRNYGNEIGGDGYGIDRYSRGGYGRYGRGQYDPYSQGYSDMGGGYY